jgi:hypothetical protein
MEGDHGGRPEETDPGAVRAELWAVPDDDPLARITLEGATTRWRGASLREMHERFGGDEGFVEDIIGRGHRVCRTSDARRGSQSRSPRSQDVHRRATCG